PCSALTRICAAAILRKDNDHGYYRQHRGDPSVRPGRRRHELPRRNQRPASLRPAVRRHGLRRADRRLGQRPALRPLLRGSSQWLIERCIPFFTYTTPRIGWAGDSTRLVATVSIVSPFRAAFMS